MSPIAVQTVRRATIAIKKGSTVIDLIQALTENLGGEWDDAELEVDASTACDFTLMAVMRTGPEAPRASREECVCEHPPHAPMDCQEPKLTGFGARCPCEVDSLAMAEAAHA